MRRNWAQGKKSLSVASLCFLTFSVYMASSIVTPAIPLYAQQEGISVVKSTLQLSLFVWGVRSLQHARRVT
jgi:DHA1 family multidrug resistance protein-like MFS transporter